MSTFFVYICQLALSLITTRRRDTLPDEGGDVLKKSLITKLIGDVEITRDLLILLLIGGIYSLGVALSNTFVNVFLWRRSGEFLDLALYNFASAALQPIAYFIAGKWAKKIDRIIVLRLGVIFLACFYFTVLLLSEKANEFLLLLGAILGIGFGFYWLAFNILTFEITEPETRDFFNGFLGLLTSLGGMIGPIVSGIIITTFETFTGYTVIFSISLSLFILAVILSFLLKRRQAKGEFQFRRIVQERKYNPNWRAVLDAHIFQGIREGTFVFVIIVWVYIATNSELALGTYGLVTSAVQFVCYYAVTRLVKTNVRKKAILFGGILLYVAVYLIVFQFTYTKLIIYGIIISVAYPLLLVPYVSLTYDVIGRSWKAAEMRVEYIVVRELFLNIGRMVSIIGFMIAISFFDETTSIPIYLLIAGAGHLCMYFFLRNVNLSQ